MCTHGKGQAQKRAENALKLYCRLILGIEGPSSKQKVFSFFKSFFVLFCFYGIFFRHEVSPAWLLNMI